MSSKNTYLESYKFQLNERNYRSTFPLRTLNYSITQPRIGRFSNYLPKIYKRNEYTFYLYNYIFQDDPDDTNIVFFDANIRKFRTRSSLRDPNESSISKTYNKLIGIDVPKNYTNYSLNRNRNNSNSNDNYIDVGLIQNRFDNSFHERRIEHDDNIYNKEFIEKMNDLKERAKIIQEIKREKDELLGLSNYSNPQKRERNLNEKRPSYRQYKNEDSNNNNNINSIQNQRYGTYERQNIKTLKDNKIPKVDNQQINNKRKSNNIEISKGNEFKNQHQNNNYQKRNINAKQNIQVINNKQISQMSNPEKVNIYNQKQNSNQNLHNSKNNQITYNSQNSLNSSKRSSQNKVNHRFYQSQNQDPIKSSKNSLQSSKNDKIPQSQKVDNINKND